MQTRFHSHAGKKSLHSCWAVYCKWHYWSAVSVIDSKLGTVQVWQVAGSCTPQISFMHHFRYEISSYHSMQNTFSPELFFI